MVVFYHQCLQVARVSQKHMGLSATSSFRDNSHDILDPPVVERFHVTSPFLGKPEAASQGEHA